MRSRPGETCSQLCITTGRQHRAQGHQKLRVSTPSAASGLPRTPESFDEFNKAAGLGAPRQAPHGFEIKDSDGIRRQLEQHHEHVLQLFGHPFNATKLEELEHDELLQDEMKVAEAAVASQVSKPPIDFAVEALEAALVGAVGEAELGGREGGEDCEAGEAHEHGVCLNGGQCVRLFGTQACSCAEGFNGVHCEDAVEGSHGVGQPAGHAVAGGPTAADDKRFHDAIAKVAAGDNAADHQLEGSVLAGERGAEAQDLFATVMNQAVAMTKERMMSLLKRAAYDKKVDMDVLLLARSMALARLPEEEQAELGRAPVKRVAPTGMPVGQAVGTMKPAVGRPATNAAPEPVQPWDWVCSAKQILRSNDCEQLTAEFGCANGCRTAPFGYPTGGDPAPSWSEWGGGMMPQVCILAPPPPTADELAKVEAERETLHETVVAGCTYSPPQSRKYLPGCVAGCKAHPTLEVSLAECSKVPTCGGVTQSADQGQRGFQLRSSSQPNAQPDDPAVEEVRLPARLLLFVAS